MLRRALIDTARELFAEHGYEDAWIDEIVQRVGVTKGGLYAHFRDKVALFEVVYQEQCVALAQAIDERIQAAESAPRQQVVLTVCHAFIDKAVDPRVWRILFVDGPSVLIQSELREPEPVLRLLRQVFAPLMDEGVIEPMPLDPFIHLVWATCFEAGIYIAQAEESAAARQEMVSTLEGLLTGLLWPESPVGRGFERQAG